MTLELRTITKLHRPQPQAPGGDDVVADIVYEKDIAWRDSRGSNRGPKNGARRLAGAD